MEKIKDILREEIKNSKGYLKQFFERCEDGSVEALEWVIDEDKFEDFFLSQSEEYSAIYDFAVVKLAGRLLKVVEEEEKVINKAIAEELSEEDRNHYFDELSEYDNIDNN